jgi:hypothetical protein
LKIIIESAPLKFSKKYPHLTWWIENHGWAVPGPDEHSQSLVRLLDEGGTWWEDEEATTIDKALENTEAFLAEELPEMFGDEFELEP